MESFLAISIRPLYPSQVPRRNHIFAIERGAFSGRGPEFTDLATTIRCVRADESGQTINVHYLKNGSATVRVVLQKQEFFIPVDESPSPNLYM